MLPRLSLIIFLVCPLVSCSHKKPPLLETCIYGFEADASGNQVPHGYCFDEVSQKSSVKSSQDLNNYVCRDPDQEKLLLQFCTLK